MIWVFLQTIVGRLLNVVVFFVLARLLSPEDFGLLAICAIFIFVGTTLMEGGLPKAIVQASEVSETQLSTVFWLNILLSVLVYSVIAITAPFIAAFYQLPELVPVLLILMSVLIINATSSVHRALLERKNSFKVVAKVSIITTALVGIFSVIMAFNGFSYWSLVFQQVVGSFLSATVLWCISSWRPKLSFNVFETRNLVRFGVGVFGTSLLTGFSRRMDDVLISIYLGVASLGLYSIAYKVFTTLNDSINFSMFRFSFARQAKIANSKRTLDNLIGFDFIFKLSLFFVGPFYLVMCVVVDDMILRYLGGTWTLAAHLAPVLLLVSVVQSVLLNMRARVLCAGYSGLFFKVEVVSSLLTVTGFFVAVQYGLLAVVWVFAMRTIVVNIPVVFVFYLRVEGINLFEFIGRYRYGFCNFCCVAVCSLVIFMIEISGWLAIAASFGFYVLSFLIFGVVLDKAFLNESVIRLRKKIHV